MFAIPHLPADAGTRAPSALRSEWQRHLRFLAPDASALRSEWQQWRFLDFGAPRLRSEWQPLGRFLPLVADAPRGRRLRRFAPPLGITSRTITIPRSALN